MCGRFAQGEFPASIRKIIRELLEEVSADYNIAPGEKAGVILREEGLPPAHKRCEWGFQPQWNSFDGKTAKEVRLINARAETVAEKPAFRAAFQRRRCLVPALGFYEWQAAPGRKIPHYFTAADEERPLVMGGIWEFSRGLRAFSILTTEANSTMSPVHSRMPVILPPEDWLDWLDPAQADARLLHAMMRPVPGDFLLRREVSTHVNNPANKGPACCQNSLCARLF